MSNTPEYFVSSRFRLSAAACRLGMLRPASCTLIGSPAEKMVAENKLSEGHARAILSVSDPAMQDRIASRIMQETLSVRQAESMARLEKRRRLTIKRVSPAYQEVETFLKQTLGTAVKIVPGLKKGRIEIEYYGNEDLNRLLDMFRKLS